MKRIEVTELERLSRFVNSFGSNHGQDFKGLLIKMIASGQSMEEVAAFSGVSSSTLYEWVKEWNEKKKLV